MVCGWLDHYRRLAACGFDSHDGEWALRPGSRVRVPATHPLGKALSNLRLQLAGAATTFCLCAKEQLMKQTPRRCATYRRARS